MASTPRKLQKSLHSSISRTLGRKLSAALKDPSHKTDIGPKFDLVATATLTLDDIHDSIKSHDLVLENLENPCHQLPLFDHFCCRLAAQPDCMSSDDTTYATLKKPKVKISSKSEEPLVYVSLHGFNLEFWKKKEHRDQGKRPLLFVTLDQSTSVHSTSDRDVTISTIFDYEEKVIEFRTQDANWISTLYQRVADTKSWGYASTNPMSIHSPQVTTSPHHGSWVPRSGSLYEETPLFDESKSCHKRPTIHDVFNLPDARRTHESSDIQSLTMLPPLPPAPPSPSSYNTRSRSSSTSTSSGSLPSWGSVRGLPNFWRFTRSSVRK